MVAGENIHAMGNPDKGRLGVSKMADDSPISSSVNIITEPIAVDIMSATQNTMGDPKKRADEMKGVRVKLKNVIRLQLTLKNLPKTMHISNIYAQDHNIGNYFDGIVSKNLSDWREVTEETMKLKVYLSTFLHLLFKLNKER